MFRKRLVLAALAVAASASAAVVLPGASNGGAKAQRTIGLITRNGAEGFFGRFDPGGQSAATALGDHLAITRVIDQGTDQIPAIKSLVAQHAAAIAIDTGRPAAVKQVLPARTGARRPHRDGVL
jgi:ABC-type sugar transport system substrate-binding protein